MVEGEHDIDMIPEPQGISPTYPMSAEKERLFKSQDAVNFEKKTVADYDNVNIERSQVSDEHLPDVPSYFPSSEQSVPLPELNDHEYK